MLFECVPELRGRAGVIARTLLPGPYTLVLPNPARRFRWLNGAPGDDRRARADLPAAAARVLSTRSALWQRRAPTSRAGPPPATLDDVPERIRAGLRRRARRRAPAGHPVDRDRLHRRRARVLREGVRRAAEAVEGRSAARRDRARRTIGTAKERTMAIAQETFEHLKTAGLAEIDPEIAELLGRELDRQRGPDRADRVRELHLAVVLEAVGSVPTNKYAEGYPGKRYYGGCEVVDEIEELARERAKAVRRRARERAAARGRAGEHGRLLRGARARRPRARALARPRRPPHARAQGQLLRGSSTSSTTTASRARR